jgi:general secretion pathway protein N
VARHDSSDTKISTNATRPPSGGNPLWQIPLTSLSATRDRPIFSPSRRPPPIVNSPIEPSKPLVVAGPDRPPLSLVGAIVGENDGIAILLDQTTKVISRVKTGDSHAGWVLRSVKGREAMLEKDHQRPIISLANTAFEYQPKLICWCSVF